MPNWTECTLTMEGLRNLPVFNEEGTLDYEFIVPGPEYRHKTNAPTNLYPVVVYLLKEYKFEDVIAKMADKNFEPSFCGRADKFTVAKELLKKGAEAFLAEHDVAYVDPFTDEETPAAVTGELAYRLHEEWGVWNWYDWNCKYWGVKWNCSQSEMLDDDTIRFFAPWSIPDGVITKLSEMYPDKIIKLEAVYEDDPAYIYTYIWENGVVDEPIRSDNPDFEDFYEDEE